MREVLSETHGDSKPNARRFDGKDSAIRGAMLGGVYRYVQFDNLQCTIYLGIEAFTIYLDIEVFTI